MTVTIITADGELAKPDNPKERLSDYHSDIESLVDVNVVGLSGQDSKIRRIILADDADISELADWLGSDLVRE